jgi:ATP citrate (pro-S)-lyase
MSAKSILEADGKAILNYHLTRAPVIKPTPLPASATHNPPPRLASLHFAADADVRGVLDQAEATYPWLLTPGSKFVAKPDQLIKRRGKSGLLALNKTWPEAKEWIEARAGKPQKVETVDGVLRQFLVEPFVPHPQDTEYYININSVREVRSFLLFLRVRFHVFLNSAEASSRRFGARAKNILQRRQSAGKCKIRLAQALGRHVRFV